jgi:hypothetical protein
MVRVVSIPTIGISQSDSSEGCPGEAFPEFSNATLINVMCPTLTSKAIRVIENSDVT